MRTMFGLAEIEAQRAQEQREKQLERQKIEAAKRKRMALKLQRSIENARMDRARKEARRLEWLKEGS